MTDAAWDDLSTTQQIAAWRDAIRKAVTALPSEDRTDLGAVVKFLLPGVSSQPSYSGG